MEAKLLTVFIEPIPGRGKSSYKRKYTLRT
jgi:hypothetical protein